VAGIAYEHVAVLAKKADMALEEQKLGWSRSAREESASAREELPEQEAKLEKKKGELKEVSEEDSNKLGVSATNPFA